MLKGKWRRSEWRHKVKVGSGRNLHNTQVITGKEKIITGRGKRAHKDRLKEKQLVELIYKGISHGLLQAITITIKTTSPRSPPSLCPSLLLLGFPAVHFPDSGIGSWLSHYRRIHRLSHLHRHWMYKAAPSLGVSLSFPFSYQNRRYRSLHGLGGLFKNESWVPQQATHTTTIRQPLPVDGSLLIVIVLLVSDSCSPK